jgi:GT2 family glycosyltransferase
MVAGYLAGPSYRSPRICVLIDPGGHGNLQDTVKSLESQGTAYKVVTMGGEAPGPHHRHLSPDGIGEISGGSGWVCVVKAGDRLAPHALAAYERAIELNPEADIIYSDDDLLIDGKRALPHFKPDWNAELFRHHDYLSNACVIRLRSNLASVTDRNDWAKSLLSAALRRGKDPVHLAFILHHRACRPSPVVPTRARAQRNAMLPLVSVIIPTRNKADLLRKCLEGLGSVDYPRLEILIVDNGSDEPATIALLDEVQTQTLRVLRYPGPFNYSALNNFAVEQASGQFLCFLNNDVEMVDGDWLRIMIGHAQRSGTGAVGARLLYPDGSIQHAGVVTGIGGGAGHAHRFQSSSSAGYFSRAHLPQYVTAVTAACLVVARDKFLAVGGFDAERFPVAFNDVDLCLKLNSRGWQSFYEPRATLIHHESKSRGSDRLKVNRERFAGELAELKRRWRTDKERDPYHHPCLSPFTEQFLIAI